MGRAKKLPIPLAIVPLRFLFSCPQPPYDINRALQRREVSSQRCGNVLPFLVLKL